MYTLVSEPPRSIDPPAIDPALATRWLVAFLRDELIVRRSIARAVVGLSGGVDSAVTAALCARALGAENVHAFRLPYATSSAASLHDAQSVIAWLGLPSRTIEITDAVDGYLRFEPDADARRRGNVMARTRMLVLFDQSAKLAALPIGTGNKTERLLGYFTWHADDTPPVNPLGDLFKTQVWALARYLDVPPALIEKAPTADLEAGQTDEGDLGITYARADAILEQMLQGYGDAQLTERGFAPGDVALVRRRVDSTHWKRHLPTTAMLTNTAINEFYLRPVDLLMRTPFFPVSLNLVDRRCVVIGDTDDREAIEKEAALRESGALVRWIRDPDALLDEDVADAFFVISTPQNAALSQRLRALADRHHFLLCCIDQPLYGFVAMAAIAKAGPVRVAISTTGLAPRVGKVLRNALQTAMDAKFVRFIEVLARRREATREAFPAPEQSQIRRAAMIEAAEGFEAGVRFEYPSWFVRRDAER